MNVTEREYAPASAPKPARPRVRAGRLISLGVLLLAIVAAIGLAPRLRRQAELKAATDELSGHIATVNVVSARRAPSSSSVSLPGNIEAVQVASIFARTNGYLRKRLVDIGDRVQAGQLLAEIESPEVEQDWREAGATLEQAKAALTQKRAALMQARANLELATVTLRRWKELVASGVMSPQSGDEKQSEFDARKADVDAAQADIGAAEASVGAHQAAVRRIEELRSFEKVTAPFAGVITARNVDVGALITSGSSSSVREIYKLAQLDVLRIYVNVPQSLVQSVQPGLTAHVSVQELPGREFTGKVARTANALDPNSRTLLTEIQLSNPNHVLLPGMYARVDFMANRHSPPLIIPATALVMRADGKNAVAIMGPDQRVHYRRVELGRDLGAEVEIVSGLKGDEPLIVNPADDLEEGSPVRAVNQAPAS
jgi:multidrug efflux system membrane fusion protein